MSRRARRLLGAGLLAASAWGCGAGADAGSARVPEAEEASVGEPRVSDSGYRGASVGERTPGRPEVAAAQDSGRVVAADSALRAMGRSLLPAAERGSGLKARGPVRLARSSRSRLEDYLARELSRQLPPGRARAVTAAYARLGLLPDTLDLRSLLQGLYMEQVVGYYDPAGDTLYVRADVPRGQVRPVLVHEMVHALQDQRMDLDSLTTALQERNDASTAAQAALEGHATYAMVEWQLGRLRGGEADLSRLPDLEALVQGQGLAEAAGMPTLSGAPALVRESLLFPYLGGLSFMQRLWRRAPDRPVPLGDDLPASTEQVLHLERYAGTDRDPPTTVSWRRDPEAPWREVHADGLGEFETRLFFETFLADSARARTAAAGWDGDAYRLLRTADDGESLVWASVWDSESDAGEFAAAVRTAYGRRYGAREGSSRRVAVRRTTASGGPAVLVVDAPAKGPRPPEELLRFRTRGGG